MEPGPSQLKAALRREARALRAQLDPEWRTAASAAIRAAILALDESRAARDGGVAVFASFGDEIDTRPLLRELIARQGSVLLPRVVPGQRRLEFRRVSDLERGMVPAYQGIPEPDPAAWPETVEPAEMGLIVVPGLFYDRQGYRLGYGGGFYDKLLAAPRRCRAVGIVFGPLLREAPLPREPFDRPVDAIATEGGLIELNAKEHRL